MRYRFADCLLDSRRRELRRGGESVHVQPRVLDVLLHLVAHRDRVVTKSELLDDIWNGASVSDAALVSAVRDARVAVGDDGRSQRVIRTVSRIGFRFVAPVHEEGAFQEAGPRSTPVERWRCEMLVELARQRAESGDYHRGGRELFLRAARMAREGGWPELYARAALGLGEVSHGIALGDRELVGVLEDALEVLSDGEPGHRVWRARLRARLAIEFAGASEQERRERLGAASLEETRHQDDCEGLAESLLARLTMLAGPQHLRERREVAHELIETADLGRREDLAVWGYSFAISSELEAGDRERLDEVLTRAVSYGGGFHHPEVLVMAEAGRAIWEGRFAMAHSLADHLEGFQDGPPLGGVVVNNLALRGWLAWLTGSPLPASWRSDLYASVPTEYAGVARAVDALLSLEHGDPQAGRLAFEASLDSPPREDVFYLFTMSALCRVATLLGDGVRAERLAALLRPWADRVAVGMSTHYLGSVHRVLGGFARFAGRVEEAIDHLEQALRMERHMRARPFAALTQRDLAVALQEAGWTAAARRELRACLREADVLGMRSLVEETTGLIDTLEGSLAAHARGAAERTARDSLAFSSQR